MTALRVVAWVAGACLIGWTAVQVERVFFFSDSYDGLLLTGVACALAMLTVATVVRFPRLRAAPALLALAWLGPYVGVIPTLPASTRILADATSWALPGLAVLTLLGSQAGRAPWRPAAALAVSGSALAVAARILLIDPFLDIDCWPVCLPNPYALQHAQGAADGLLGIAVLLVVAGLVESIRRSWERTRLDRAAEGAAAVCVVGLLLLPATDARPGGATLSVLVAVVSVATLTMAAMLLVREARERTLRRQLTDVAIALASGRADGSVAPAMAALLGDPGLAIRYWAADQQRFVDDTGDRCEDPRPGAPERTTPVTRRGQLLAVIVHSRPTHADRVGTALGPALQLALENEQLRAVSLAELGELEASRHRILQRTSEERRRLERDLHDGAQQRVVSLFLLLRTLAPRLPQDQALLVEEAAANTHDLLDDLRRIARGIHPAVVADAGLAGALADLADTSRHTVVTMSGQPVAGLSHTAETTAYELVSTALADAQAGSATRFEVRSAPVGNTLVLEVDHDAPVSSPASALEGQVPFVEALSGRLDVRGSPGSWRIRLELPCAS